MTQDTNAFYVNFFNGWNAKDLGPKPTAKDLDSIHKLGARHGKQVLAIAMSLRSCGVTGSQIVMACGAPQLNKMRGFVTDGMLQRELVAPDHKGHTVYKHTFTKKGLAKINASTVTVTKPKIKAAPKKAKVKKPVVQAPAPMQEVTTAA